MCRNLVPVPNEGVHEHLCSVFSENSAFLSHGLGQNLGTAIAKDALQNEIQNVARNLNLHYINRMERFTKQNEMKDMLVYPQCPIGLLVSALRDVEQSVREHNDMHGYSGLLEEGLQVRPPGCVEPTEPNNSLIPGKGLLHDVIKQREDNRYQQEQKPMQVSVTVMAPLVTVNQSINGR